MKNPEINTDIWTALRQKWINLDEEGHTIKVDFNILKDPKNGKDLAIDVVQKIDDGWIVQTVQHKPREAYRVLGMQRLEPGQLLELARHLVRSITEPMTGHATYDEVHLFMKRISPETSEVYGYVISESGERISLRTNYQHYYVLNEILEQTSKARQKQYSELQVHRDKGENGRISFSIVPTS